MATNNFKPFATGAGANVMSQADWEALTALLTGFKSGKAASAQVNKALRQGTVMASVIGQFIADSTGQDVLDNGNTSVLLTNFLNALKANTNGRLLNVRTFTASGTYTPTTGTKKIRVRLVGGGGAGGGAAASTVTGNVAAGHGGTAGTYGETGLIDVSSVSSVAVTVGAGGNGSSGGNGTAGGVSAFGTYISAPGGQAGAAGSSTATTQTIVSDHSNGSPCTGANVLVSIPGQGGFGQVSLNANTVKGGQGGSSVLGLGGGAYTTNATPNPGTGYGGGGAGSVTTVSGGSTATAGGNGSQGIVIIEEYA